MDSKTLRFAILTAGVLAGAIASPAAELSIPSPVTAGSEIRISTSGSGTGTLYVYGPGTAIKRKVQLGQAIPLSGEDVKNAGRYVVSIDGNDKGSFYVVPATVTSISFLARPSRVPADTAGVISGTAFVFDKYENLITTPQNVKFDLTVNGQSVSRTEATSGGVAYTRLDSTKREGAAQFTASSGAASVRRVVQIVASDPCNLRMHAQAEKNGILVETDPVRDCAGNPVPDGTIVTFTATDASGRSTVDARIKRGVARALLPASGNANISVAAGVVIGNEIHWGGGR